MSKHRGPLPIPELGDFNTTAAAHTVSGGRKRPLKKNGTGDSADKPSADKGSRPPTHALPRTGRPITVRQPAPDAETAIASPFELSRLYAKGWAAGMGQQIDDTLIAIDARAEALNPFRISGERARWMQGFTEAVRAKLARPSQKRPLFRTGFTRLRSGP